MDVPEQPLDDSDASARREIAGRGVLDQLDDDEPEMDVAPSVVAVLVVREPGLDLDEALRGLAEQDYPNLTVLVADAGSDEDLAPRIASVLAGAYLRSVEPGSSFAAAANEAMSAVEGASFLFLCGGRGVAEPATVRQLVEEAYRSNAAILGPKIVSLEEPDRLLEVGLAADRFGVRHHLVEPGELDQEQHDAVRDVFAVGAEAMLIRADLVAELRGFDEALTEDVAVLDLCWRARVAGARVMVVPDARFGLGAAPTALAPASSEDPRDQERSRLLALLSVSSWRTLAALLPQLLVLSVAEVVAFVVTGRRSRARALLHGWAANLRHPGALRRRRAAVRAIRRVPDADVRYLQTHGSARLRGFLSQRIDAEARARALAETGQHLVDAARDRSRRAPLAVASVLLALLAFGARDLVFGGAVQVGSLVSWGSVSDLWRELTSGWRSSGIGSPAPAPPAAGMMAALALLLGGSVELARALVLALAIPVGAVGAGFAAHRLFGRDVPALAAAVAYAAVPVPRNAIAEGRLGPLVFYALAPVVVGGILATVERSEGVLRGSPGSKIARRDVLRGGVALAACGAVFPPALVLVPLSGLAMLVAAPLARGFRASVLGVRFSVRSALVGVALLAPWSIALVMPSADLGAVGLAFRPVAGLGEVLRMETGPAGAGATGWALLAAAAAALVVARGSRGALAIRCWILAALGWGLTWAPRALGLEVWFAPEGTLVLSALGLALAVGIGAATFGEQVRGAHLGRRHVASFVAALAFAWSCVPLSTAAFDGRWGLPGRDWSRSLGWMAGDSAADGDFRVLWVGDLDLLPLEPWHLRDGIGFGLTRGGAYDVGALWPSPLAQASEPVRDAVEVSIDRRTDRLGHLLAPMGVRYVVVPLAPGPLSGLSAKGAGFAAELVDGLAAQGDLAALSTQPGLVLYENLAWVPSPVIVTGDAAGETRRDSALTAELGADDEAPAPTGASGPAGEPDPQSSVVLWAEAYDRRWQARLDGVALEHREAFGVANAFEQVGSGHPTIRYQGQWFAYPVLALQVAIWALVAAAWWRSGRATRVPESGHAVEPTHA